VLSGQASALLVVPVLSVTITDWNAYHPGILGSLLGGVGEGLSLKVKGYAALAVVPT
jgi:hypothetical protein